MLTTTAPSTCFRLSSPGQGIAQHRPSAYRRGLTGQIHILTSEEQTAFESHCQGIRGALAPVGALEINLARSIAENRWRLKPAHAIESGIFATGLQRPCCFLGTPSIAAIARNQRITKTRHYVATMENVRKAGIQMPAAA
jgi:hypothetical protein